MTDYLKEARDFLKEAIEQFEEGASKGDKVLMRDACEKGWGAVVQATNELFVREGYRDLPKSHRDRRLLLYEIEKRDKQVESMAIVDRFMARDDALHMRGFYNGDIDPEEVRLNFAKVEQFIEDIEKVRR
jgi:hypothetical protein